MAINKLFQFGRALTCVRQRRNSCQRYLYMYIHHATILSPPTLLLYQSLVNTHHNPFPRTNTASLLLSLHPRLAPRLAPTFMTYTSPYVQRIISG